MAKSIFSERICVFKDYYSRELVGYTFSISNFLSCSVWLLIFMISFGAAFSAGGKLKTISSSYICCRFVDKGRIVYGTAHR